MQVNKTRRWLILGTLLVLSVLDAAQVESESAAPLEPVLVSDARPRTVRTSVSATTPDDAGTDGGTDAGMEKDANKFYRRTVQHELKDLFAAQSWYVPPEPVAAAVSAPSAPPVPFIYLGKLVEDGKPVIFLARDAKNYAVREGDILDETYRVGAIRGALMELTYMPLDIRQNLAIGEQH